MSPERSAQGRGSALSFWAPEAQSWRPKGRLKPCSAPNRSEEEFTLVSRNESQSLPPLQTDQGRAIWFQPTDLNTYRGGPPSQPSPLATPLWLTVLSSVVHTNNGGARPHQPSTNTRGIITNTLYHHLMCTYMLRRQRVLLSYDPSPTILLFYQPITISTNWIKITLLL